MGVPPNRAPIVGVPRNFATGHLLAMVTLFALVFSTLSYQEAARGWYVVWGLFITAIILGQMFLFGGKDPRKASCVTGACAAPLLLAGTWIVYEGLDPLLRQGPIFMLTLIPLCFGTAVMGTLVGYLVGTVCAGIFLVTERRWHAGQIVEEEPIVAEIAGEDGKFADVAREGDPWGSES
ncbi:MAG: hypothetical protein ACYC6Y_16520 [Thermoguttaceae bacterium]